MGEVRFGKPVMKARRSLGHGHHEAQVEQELERCGRTMRLFGVARYERKAGRVIPIAMLRPAPPA